jgi:hypothetical protein
MCLNIPFFSNGSPNAVTVLRKGMQRSKVSIVESKVSAAESKVNVVESKVRLVKSKVSADVQTAD